MSIDIKQKTGTIVGFGRSGIASANLILRLGGRVKISDAAPRDKIEPLLKSSGLEGEAIVEAGAHTKDFIQASDFIVLSPGVRFDAELVRWAKEKNIPVYGEIEFAFSFCKNPIVAVTGSNGKTTTVTLIHQILQKAGKKACLCGNVGTPFTKYVLDLAADEIVVLEISSFQLETTINFRPKVGVILNCTQNHLDRHKDMEEYFSAKARLFMNQTKDDYAVLNYDDPKTNALAPTLKSRVLFFNNPSTKAVFPDDNPNFSAARCAVKAFGVTDEIVNEVFKNFKGIEHRQEWVRTINGVDFINDSKATTVEAGRYALESMQKPVVMICGGLDKHLDFRVLRELAQKKVKHMVVIGQAKEKIRKSFEDVLPVEECTTLSDAVLTSLRKAEKGDCVLLAPMCASFDMFANFEERGREFKRLVQEL